jgi:hypothetical protein
MNSSDSGAAYRVNAGGEGLPVPRRERLEPIVGLPVGQPPHRSLRAIPTGLFKDTRLRKSKAETIWRRFTLAHQRIFIQRYYTPATYNCAFGFSCLIA